nr:MAG TPA: hypothetical protein [Caudoviricetes sp.]
MRIRGVRGGVRHGADRLCKNRGGLSQTCQRGGFIAFRTADREYTAFCRCFLCTLPLFCGFAMRSRSKGTLYAFYANTA